MQKVHSFACHSSLATSNGPISWPDPNLKLTIEARELEKREKNDDSKDSHFTRGINTRTAIKNRTYKQFVVVPSCIVL